MIGMIRAQLMLLTRRPLLWVLLAVHVLLLLAQFILPILTIQAAERLATLQQGGGRILAPEAIAQLRFQALFPGALAVTFSHINSVGGLLLMILAGAFIGADFNWGTTRTYLARTPGRSRYLLAKCTALLILAALLVLMTLTLGLVLGLLNHALFGEPARLSAQHLAALLPSALRSYYGLLPYLFVAVAFGVTGRSTAAGIGGSLFFWIVEVTLGIFSVIRTAGTVGKQIYDLTIAQNVGALTELTRRAFGLNLQQTAGPLELSFPNPVRAALMVLLYSLLLLATALLQLRRRDIGGPR